MHPATLLVRPETPRFERSAALPSSPPPRIRLLVLVRHFPPSLASPLKALTGVGTKWNPQYRWLLPKDASLPPRRTLRAEKGARSRFLSRSSVSLVRSETLTFSFTPLGPALAPSYAKRRDVDSLLGSNFYGDASPNISGKPRLLALVFDERTSRSILSGETSFSTSFLLPPYS